MSIRNRLLVLLLAIALTPLVFTSLLQQASIWVMRNRLADKARANLEGSAREALQERLQSDVEILEIDRRLADVQLRRQVREVEQRLAGIAAPARGPLDRPPEGPGMGPPGFEPAGGRGGGVPDFGPRAARFAQVNAEFGLDPNLNIPAESQHSYFSSSKVPASSAGTQSQAAASSNGTPASGDANSAALKVNYKAQSCLLAGDANEAVARQAMDKLASMTRVYRDICTRGSTGILWLHTSLDIGLYMTYPGGVTPKDLSRYNPAREPWYRLAWLAFQNQRRTRASGPAAAGDANDARRGRGMRFGGFRRGRGMRAPRNENQAVEARQGVLARDPFTGEEVVIRSMPITYADGEFAGAAAIVRTVPEIFASLQLPERWGTDIERMLILVDPNAMEARFKVRVLLDEGGRSDRSREQRMNPSGPGGPEPGGPFGGPPPVVAAGAAAPPPPEGIPMRGARGPGGAFAGRGGFRDRYLADDVNDVSSLELVAGDIMKDQDGVRQVNYNGRSCLLAYQPLDIPYAAAVLVVPYDRVVAMASEVEQSLVKESVRGLQIMTLAILLVGAAAVSLAAVRARDLTRPIHALIEAGKRLGNGDYNAHVEIRTNDELEHLGRVFNETGPKLRDHARMKQSLELASAIQHSLLPGRTPDLKHFELAGRCVYCDETGGDYYDFIRVAGFQPALEGETPSTQRGQDGCDTKIGLAIGDVSGHGIGAALLMAVTRGLLHAEAPHMRDDLASLMTRLNRELVHDTASETFVTLFYGILNDAQRSLVWASAGHEPATWCHASTRRIEELPNTGMLLGVSPTAVYGQAGPVTFAPGDILVVGTDGIWEAHDNGGHFFGKDRLHRIVQDAADLSADQICDRIIDSVALFAHPAPRADDITLIVVKAK
jgi:serine phosphatase RsbU (regulator of sigma subunit)